MEEKNKQILKTIFIGLAILASYFIVIFSCIWCILHKIEWYYIILILLITFPILTVFTMGFKDIIDSFKYNKNKEK